MLLYGILQVLSTLSVDVHSLKHVDGVRYFLCTDLKRCPEWVTNGQTSILEPIPQRSWCWQRAWDPTPIRAAPVELEATTLPDRTALPSPRSRSNTQLRGVEQAHNTSSPPQRPLPPAPLDFDGATLMQNDIIRIGEKIDALSMTANASRLLRTEYERRRENEKVMAGEFKAPRLNDVGIDYRHLRTEDTHHHHRLAEHEYATRPLPRLATAHDDHDRDRERERQIYATRPLPPPRSPLRSPVLSDAGTDLAGYPFSGGGGGNGNNSDNSRADHPYSPVEMGFPSPPGYAVGTMQQRERERSASRPPPPGYASKPPGYEERGGGAAAAAVRRERERERGRAVYERGGWCEGGVL